jgi:hypothetical protein
MALSIVADSSASSSMPGVKVSARWVCDVFTGAADALIAAGVVTAGELKPQHGRPEWRMTFLPNGQPCPPARKAWREPGYKSIWHLEDGNYQVEVTVSKEVQAARRKAEKAAEYEREQLRINEEVEQSGHKYRDWKLQHGYSGLPGIPASYGYGAEWWEGTKAQLQSVGIGVGMVFPGEPGGPDELHCKCPLGFDVRVWLAKGYDRAKAAAGIYNAASPYVPRHDEPKQYVKHAPGVTRELWQPDGWRGSDFYHGTDAALVAAGLVPSIDMFPGQPGRNKGQASYQLDGSPVSNSPHRKVRITIRRRGKGNQFVVEVPVSKAEEQRRDEVREQQKKEHEKRQRELAQERQNLRQLSHGVSVEDFRTKRSEDLERWMQLLWRSVFHSPDGLLSFDMPEGSESLEELAGAFQTLRDLVAEAPIARDKKLEAEMAQRQKVAAARNDTGLQNLLMSAKYLRLVHPTPPDDEQG